MTSSPASDIVSVTSDGATIKPVRPGHAEPVRYPDGTTLKVWKFHEAPDGLRWLSTNGGDEDYIVAGPVQPDGVPYDIAEAPERISERLAVSDNEAAQTGLRDENDQYVGLTPPPEVLIDGVLSRIWITCHA